jgi:hypothetical protein
MFSSSDVNHAVRSSLVSLHSNGAAAFGGAGFQSSAAPARQKKEEVQIEFMQMATG